MSSTAILNIISPPAPFNMYDQRNSSYPAEYVDQAWEHFRNGVHQVYSMFNLYLSNLKNGHWKSVPIVSGNAFHASHTRFLVPTLATVAYMPFAPLSHIFDASLPDMTRRVDASTPTATRLLTRQPQQ
jgi:hypothetical protein